MLVLRSGLNVPSIGHYSVRNLGGRWRPSSPLVVRWPVAGRHLMVSDGGASHRLKIRVHSPRVGGNAANITTYKQARFHRSKETF